MTRGQVLVAKEDVTAVMPCSTLPDCKVTTRNKRNSSTPCTDQVMGAELCRSNEGFLSLLRGSSAVQWLALGRQNLITSSL